MTLVDRNTVTFSYQKNIPDDRYHFPELIWNRPSVNAYGSMPLGNGDIGINLWVEENGDLLFYISKTDSYSEDQQLLKLGRIRVRFSGNPFGAGKAFRQVLNIQEGTVTIDAGALRLLIRVDAHAPLVRIEGQSSHPFESEVSLELWRTALRAVTNPKETHSYMMQALEHEKVHEYPDTVAEAPGALLWYHRNERSAVEECLRRQDMAPLVGQVADPLLGLTFGGRLQGKNLHKKSPTLLTTPGPVTDFTLDCVVLTEQCGKAGDWIESVGTLAAHIAAQDPERTRTEHQGWWHGFWGRSHVRISGTPEAETVSRAYELQRYMHACQGRGRFPIKFNGGLFTTAHGDEGWGPDYRLWGGSFWIQNGRLNYWPMLMDGDFDFMQPFFDLYRRNLPVARERARLLGAQGAIFPETMAIFGTFNTENYGYKRPEGLAPGLAENTYIRRYWQGSIEISTLMLDYRRYTGDADFGLNILVPFAMEILRFFKSHYSRRDENGKILFSPSQSLETWQEAVNPTPEIAGLEFLTRGLLELPETELTEKDRHFCHQLRDLLPPLPTRSWFWTGKKVILPALQYDQNYNWENPELYAVFPYRLYGVGKPDLERGIATYHERLVKETGCWMQDAIQSALLGLTEEARRDVVKNASHYHPKSRFPAYWDSGGKNFDWIPDQDHGGVILLAVQRMLMQCDDGKIHLLPAWPREWDVDFTLHAPERTVVEAVYRAGKLEQLKVTPETRRKDIMVPDDIAKAD